ncbi:MAG: thiol:disulfide interchange protein DsbA/DsbL [Betaproteobacteria bacterium]|nr:thiol:disulfide interchange protein DsbA/DsbL [Betaproteobacteria bacterium]
MPRHRWLVAVVATLASLLLGAASAAPVAGRDYTEVRTPQPTESGDKVEVLEFFWYGCPHCFDLEPKVAAWAKKLPKDAELRRIPVAFRDSWLPGARIYYTLEAMGDLARLHGPVFDAIHVEHINLGDEKVMLDWMASKGVDRKKFAETYSSFSVNSKVQRAQQITKGYGLDGVPAMAVNGRWVTSGTLTGSHDSMLSVVDQLIARARAEKGRK